MRRVASILVLRIFLLAAACSLVAGCGFQLQGRAPLPRMFAVVQIDATDAQSDFVQDLRRSMLAAGMRVTREHGEATAIIRVERDELTERVLSVSGRNIPAESELTYTVRVAVSSGGSERLAAEDMSLSREFSFDESRLLAKRRERDTLQEALARDLVGMVMRRFSAL
jgi:LPS-assembly lipoprotein